MSLPPRPTPEEVQAALDVLGRELAHIGGAITWAFERIAGVVRHAVRELAAPTVPPATGAGHWPTGRQVRFVVVDDPLDESIDRETLRRVLRELNDQSVREVVRRLDARDFPPLIELPVAERVELPRPRRGQGHHRRAPRQARHAAPPAFVGASDRRRWR